MYTMSMCTHVAFVSVTDTSTIKRQHSTRRVPHACLAHQIHDAWPLLSLDIDIMRVPFTPLTHAHIVRMSRLLLHHLPCLAVCAPW